MRTTSLFFGNIRNGNGQSNLCVFNSVLSPVCANSSAGKFISADDTKTKRLDVRMCRYHTHKWVYLNFPVWMTGLFKKRWAEFRFLATGCIAGIDHFTVVAPPSAPTLPSPKGHSVWILSVFSGKWCGFMWLHPSLSPTIRTGLMRGWLSKRSRILSSESEQ